jgi:hypothetical protein
LWEALVSPGQKKRAEKLRAAIDIAGSDPRTLSRAIY